MNSTNLVQDNTWYLHHELDVDISELPLEYELPDNHTYHGERWFVVIKDGFINIENDNGGQRAVFRKYEINDFVGVVLQVFESEQHETIFAVSLSHKYLEFWIPLYVTFSDGKIIEKWQGWAQMLSLPMLAEESDGSLRHPFSILSRLKEITPDLKCAALFKKMKNTGIWPVLKNFGEEIVRDDEDRKRALSEMRKHIKIVKSDFETEKLTQANKLDLKTGLK